MRAEDKNIRLRYILEKLAERRCLSNIDMSKMLNCEFDIVQII